MSASGSLWLIPALPLVGAVVILLIGKRLGRSAGIFAAVLVAASFVVSVAVAGSLVGLSAQDRVQTQELFEWIRVGAFSVGVDAPPRPAVGDDDPGRHGRRRADPHLLDRLHARRSRVTRASSPT